MKRMNSYSGKKPKQCTDATQSQVSLQDKVFKVPSNAEAWDEKWYKWYLAASDPIWVTVSLI